MKEEIIGLYRKRENVKSFDKSRSKYAYQRYKHKIEANFLKKAIKNLKKNKVKVLDVACGTGRMLPEVFLTGKNIEYQGIDTSKIMLNELKKKSKRLGKSKNVKTLIADATKLPFKYNTFDIVYTYHLLWHLEEGDQKKIILEMKRVTKKGGIIIFDILNKNFVWERFKKYSGKKKEEGLHKQEISEIKKILGDIDNIEIEKLSDAIIKNDNIYKLFNIINVTRSFLPSFLFHMIYFGVKK